MTTKKQAEALAARLGLRVSARGMNAHFKVYRSEQPMSYFALCGKETLYFARGSAALLAWLEGWEARQTEYQAEYQTRYAHLCESWGMQREQNP